MLIWTGKNLQVKTTGEKNNYKRSYSLVSSLRTRIVKNKVNRKTKHGRPISTLMYSYVKTSWMVGLGDKLEIV